MTAEPTYWHAPSLDEPYDESLPFEKRQRHQVPADQVGPKTNLQSSLWTDGKHRPTLDIDVPVEIRPSATPGHCHLVFPTIALEWEEYELLLGWLARVGILEEGFVGASRQPTRRMTFIRTPWTRKNHDLDRARKSRARTPEQYLEG